MFILAAYREDKYSEETIDLLNYFLAILCCLNWRCFSFQHMTSDTAGAKHLTALWPTDRAAMYLLVASFLNRGVKYPCSHSTLHATTLLSRKSPVPFCATVTLSRATCYGSWPKSSAWATSYAQPTTNTPKCAGARWWMVFAEQIVFNSCPWRRAGDGNFNLEPHVLSCPHRALRDRHITKGGSRISNITGEAGT